MARTESESADPLTLDEFPPHRYDEWKAAAEQLLKGVPFEKRLITATDEGFDLQPLYRREDLDLLPHLGDPPGEGNLHRGSRHGNYKQTPWLIAQEAPWRDPESFNQGVKRDLEKGVTEMLCRIGGPAGLRIRNLDDLKTALTGVDLEAIRFTFEAGTDTAPFAALLFAFLEDAGVNLDRFKGCLGCDPLGALAAGGNGPFTLETAFEPMVRLTRLAQERSSGLKSICVSGRPYADGGCGPTREIAYVLATAVEYLRRLDAAGLEVSRAAGAMQFSLSIGPHFFMEIAKLRAVRLLWSRIADSLGVEENARKIFIHCRTGRTNKTLYDPHTNLLRNCTEALSAILGGCDSLTIAPYDELRPNHEGPARRIARNMHFILAEECNLNRVVDPGGGSYYLEHLTDQVARTAWQVFQSIEKEGGMAESLTRGIPQSDTRAKAEEKRKQVASRRVRIVGVNFYANSKETVAAGPASSNAGISRASDGEAQGERIRLDGPDRVAAAITAARAGATLHQIGEALHPEDGPAGKTIASIAPFRLAGDYEALRQAAEAYQDKHGHRPRIFQVNLGPSRKYRLRADWTSGFFQAGGFAVLNDRDFADENEAARAVVESGAQLAILTSDDATYTEKAPGLASALKDKLPDLRLLLAGTPGENETAWREAGIDDFIHVRSNNYETLKSLFEEMGATT